jgi:hypothetical protein
MLSDHKWRFDGITGRRDHLIVQHNKLFIGGEVHIDFNGKGACRQSCADAFDAVFRMPGGTPAMPLNLKVEEH